MNQRTYYYSILFSVLLASTFFHEIRAKGSANSIFGPLRNKRNVNYKLPPACKVVCDDTISKVQDDLQFPSLLAFPEVELLGVARLKLGFGLVIDLRSRIIGIISGTTGEAIFISKNIGYYLSCGSFGDRSNFKDIFYSFKSGLEVVLQLSGGLSFKVSSFPDNVVQLINKILSHLVFGLSDQIEADGNIAVRFLLDFIKDVFSTAHFIEMPRIIGKKIINLPCDLPGLMTFGHGFNNYVGTISGNFSSLLAPGTTFDINTLLNSKNGLETFTDIIAITRIKSDFLVSLGLILNDPVTLFQLLAQFDVPNGVFKFIANVIAYVHGKILLEPMIFVLIQTLSLPNTHSVTYDISAALINSLKRFLNALEKLKATQALSKCIITLRSLIDGNLVMKGVNISSIILLLRDLKPGVAVNVQVVFEIICQTLVHLKPVVSLEISLPRLMMVLLVGSRSSFGIHMFKSMGMTPKDFFIPANLIGSDRNFLFFKPMNELLSFYFADLSGFLSSLPGFGHLYSILIPIINRITGIKIRILLNSLDARDLFKACFQECGGHNLGANPELTKIIMLIRDTCNQPQVHWTITPTPIICEDKNI